MKVFSADFLCLQFGFGIFCQNEIGAKASHKILVKLAKVVPTFYTALLYCTKVFLQLLVCL